MRFYSVDITPDAPKNADNVDVDIVLQNIGNTNEMRSRNFQDTRAAGMLEVLGNTNEMRSRNFQEASCACILEIWLYCILAAF
jgi:hypothetical protein